MVVLRRAGIRLAIAVESKLIHVNPYGNRAPEQDVSLDPFQKIIGAAVEFPVLAIARKCRFSAARSALTPSSNWLR